MRGDKGGGKIRNKKEEDLDLEKERRSNRKLSRMENRDQSMNMLKQLRLPVENFRKVDLVH